jgi:hypothetical protein
MTRGALARRQEMATVKSLLNTQANEICEEPIIVPLPHAVKGSSIFNFALLVYTPPAITMLEEATE